MAAPPRSSGWFARLLLAHLLAYPIALVWAVAAIPPLIPLYEEALIGLVEMQEVADFLVQKTAWPAGVAFVLAHAFAVPWAIAAPRDRGQRLFAWAAGGLFVAGVIVGAVGWAWLLLR